MAREQVAVNQSFLQTVDNKNLKEIRIPTIVRVNVPVPLQLYVSYNWLMMTLDHVFHTNIIAYF